MKTLLIAGLCGLAVACAQVPGVLSPAPVSFEQIIGDEVHAVVLDGWS